MPKELNEDSGFKVSIKTLIAIGALSTSLYLALMQCTLQYWPLKWLAKKFASHFFCFII